MDQLAQISASGDEEAYLDALTQMWLDGPNQPGGRVPSPVRDLFRQMVNHNTGLPNRNQLISHIEPGASRRLVDIQVPTLVMYGALDYPDEIDASIAIANGINGAKLQVFPDAAHMVPMEQPERFCDCVETFLNQWNCLSK
jgi:pimeloyl-ACP methyl ester carboxylesterase